MSESETSAYHANWIMGCLCRIVNMATCVYLCVWEGRVIVWRVLCVCTWDAFALDGLGDDGQWLVARLTQHLAQLLHTVAVHDDGLPAAITQHRGAALDFVTVLLIQIV